MKKPQLKSSSKNRFPRGLDESKVRRLIKHYESQTQSDAAAEDDALFGKNQHTFMQIPTRFVPAVRKLISKRAG